MFMRFSDDLKSEWDKRLLPLWCCFLWICAAPFLSFYRVGPLSSFYLEAASLLGALMLVLVTAYKGLLSVRLPKAAVGLLVLAAFWWLQARMMDLIYVGMNDMVMWTFVILALAVWACRGWVAAYGQERIVTVFAWSLLFGTLLQAAIAFIQFKGWYDLGFLRSMIVYSGKEVSGQLGQRNHLGHYLMWGVLAAAYLWSTRKMPGWLGFLLVFLMTAVLGLVNSRTILGYVAGVALILPLWRWRAGRDSARQVRIFFLTVALVAVFQFTMGSILELLGNGQYETAVERAGNSGFEGSMRQIEWRKAWTAFLSAPWFGHGWNSFAQQTFWINAEQQYFPNNILGVLFTHSHNIVLQLLSEVGLVGTVLVALTMLAGLWRMLVRPYHPASLLLLSMVAVSMCHSMLEYPLWYIYFLTPFVLMFALAPARYEDVSDDLAWARGRNWAGGLTTLLIIGGLLHMGWTYTDLVDYSRIPKNESTDMVGRKINGLRHISENSPMLAYYADLSLTRRAEPTDMQVKPWAEKAAINSLSYRPYSNAYQVALYLYRQGKTEEGAKWMQAMQYYYPYMMSFYAGKLRSHPVFQPLLPKLLADCKDFVNAPKHEKAKSCDVVQ